MAAKTKATSAVKSLVDQLVGQGLTASIGLTDFHINAYTTGIHSLDHAIGVGGFPRGRISMLVGKEASGKTLILLRTIAAAQKQGHPCAFVDAEHALTPQFASMLGVNIDNLVVVRPHTLEEGYNALIPMAKSGLFAVVGYDSVVALATQAELEAQAGDSSQRASIAQVHSQELRKLTSSIHDETAVILVNQQRERPQAGGYGSPTYEPGGRGLRHHSSLILDIKSTEVYRDSRGVRKGHKIKAYAKKNKVGVPYRTAEFDINYVNGVDEIMNLVDTALLTGIISRNGTSWYAYTIADQDGEVIEEFKWNGRAAMEAEIRENEGLVDSIVSELGGDSTLPPGGWEEV